MLRIKDIPTELSKDHFGTNYSILAKTKDDDKIGLSADDRKFLEIMDMSFEGQKWSLDSTFTIQRATGHPTQQQVLALKRAYSLDVSLKNNPTKRDHMVTFMKGIIDRGAADVAPPIPEDKEYWYM